MTAHQQAINALLKAAQLAQFYGDLEFARECRIAAQKLKEDK